MTFPIAIPLGPWLLPPHVVLEALAYTIGFQLYLRARRRQGDAISDGTRWSVIAAAIAGAAIGSKVLFWFEDPFLTWAHRADILFLMGGKTVVGGLVGGLIGVELTKRVIGETRSTGDLFAVPLAAGMAIGRIGCFMAGLSDQTCGVATSLPWGVDFGDGVRRHPTQLYEAAYLLPLALLLARAARRPHQRGDIFKLFMVGYMTCRLGVDAIKPGVTFAGLTVIQWTAAAVLLYYAPAIVRWSRNGWSAPRDPLLLSRVP